MRKMNKTLLLSFIWIIIAILTVSFNLAALSDSNVLYLSFDNADLFGTNVVDLSGNDNGTNHGATTGITGKLGEAFSCDGTDDYIDLISSNNPLAGIGTGDFTISYWFNDPTFLNYEGFITFGRDNSGAEDTIITGTQATTNSMKGYVDSEEAAATLIESNNNVSVGNWHLLILERSSGTITLYINSSNEGTSGTSHDLSDSDFNAGFNICAWEDSIGAPQGFAEVIVDELSIWDRVLTSDERAEIFNSGTGYNFYTPNATVVNESLESTIFGVQNGSQTIISGTYTPILSAGFNVTKNLTKSYLAVTNMVWSSNNAIADCRIILNGIDYNSSVTRTIASGDTGNMYFTTDEITLLNETTYTAVFECRRSTSSYQVNNTVGVGHLLVNQNEEDVPYQFERFSDTINDDTIWTLMDTYTFTIDSAIGETGDNQSLVLDWSSTYQNTATGTQLYNMYFEIEGYRNCSQVPRTVTGNSIGSVGGNCLVNPITPSETVTINVYGKGLNAQFDGKLHIKNFLSGTDELNSVEINATAPLNQSFQLISSILVNNTNHDGANMFYKFSNAITSDTATLCSGYSILRDGGFSQQTNTVSRTVNTNTGVANFQWVFTNASKTNYSLDTYIKCDDVATIDFIGEPIIYMTDAVTFPKTSFTVTPLDNYDDSSIIGFNVTLDDGTVFSFGGSSGEVFVTEGINLTNLTITTSYQGGYFPVIVLNHLTNSSLIVYMNQTEVRWDCIEKVSTLDLTCTQPLETDIFNYNTLNNPHSQSLNVTGYYENIQEFNVTALQNTTFLSSMYSSFVSLKAKSDFGSPLQCNYSTSSDDYIYTNSFIANPNGTIGLINGSYNITADCSGFAIDTLNLTVDDVTETLIFNLTPTNSVNITFRDADTGSILSNLTITVDFIGATSFTNTTTVGWLFQDLFSPDDYTVTALADGYRQTEYFFTLLNRTFNPITMYMQKENNSELVLLTVRDKFSKTPIQNAQVTIQRWRNGTWVTDQILTTDFNGQVEGHYILSTVFYIHVVEFNGVNFFGTINSNDDKKVIYTEDVNNGIFLEIDISPNNVIPTYQNIYSVSTTLNFTNTSNTTGQFRYSWDDEDNFDRIAILSVTKLGVVVCNETATSESGILFCNVNITAGEGLTYFFASTSIDSIPDLGYIASLGVDDERNINFGALGYLVAFFLMLIFWTMFLNVPNISLYLISGLFVVLILFGFIFKGVNFFVWSLIMFLAFLIGRLVSKQGVNA